MYVKRYYIRPTTFQHTSKLNRVANDNGIHQRSEQYFLFRKDTKHNSDREARFTLYRHVIIIRRRAKNGALQKLVSQLVQSANNVLCTICRYYHTQHRDALVKICAEIGTDQTRDRALTTL